MQAGTASFSDIDARLGRLESRLDAVSEALVQGDGDALLLASTLLRDAAVDVAGLLPVPVASVKAGGPVLQRRLVAVGSRFASCRENLARRSAGVERAVASLLPAAAGDQTTYGKVVGRAGGGSRFGSRAY